MEAPRCGFLSCGSGGLLQLDRKSPVRFVGLASLLAVGAVFFSILWPLRWSLAALWLAIEALFFTFIWRPRWAALDSRSRRYPTSHDAMGSFRRVLRYFRETPGIDTDMYYSGWFLGAKFEDIKRGALNATLSALNVAREELWVIWGGKSGLEWAVATGPGEADRCVFSLMLQGMPRSSWHTHSGTGQCELSCIAAKLLSRYG